MLRCFVPRCQYIGRTRNFRHFSLSSPLKDARQVFIWGNGNEGQLGLGDIAKKGTIFKTYEELTPQQLQPFSDVNISKLSLGLIHSAAVDSRGQLWTWGRNKNGVLGLLGVADDAIVTSPQKVEALTNVKIIDVSCGDSHTAAVDEEGQVYTWGRGGSWYQGLGGLGHGSTETVNEPRLVTKLIEEHVVISKIGCAESHTVALSSDGEVWAWGNGEYGRLGNGGSLSAKVPEPVDFFANDHVTQIAVGQAFTLALTAEGALYCWGRNDQGQLGLGGGLTMDVYSMESFPRVIESNALQGKEIIQMSAGTAHAAVVTADGKLFVWGMKIHLEPYEVTALRDFTIVAVDCGTNYTAALTDNGELFTFGKGNSRSLGQADGKTRQLPELVASLQPHFVHTVSCGAKHAAVIASERNSATDKDFSMRT